MMQYTEKTGTTLLAGASGGTAVARINGSKPSSWPVVLEFGIYSLKIAQDGGLTLIHGGPLTENPAIGKSADIGSFSFHLTDGVTETGPRVAAVSVNGVAVAPTSISLRPMPYSEGDGAGTVLGRLEAFATAPVNFFVETSSIPVEIVGNELRATVPIPTGAQAATIRADNAQGALTQELSLPDPTADLATVTMRTSLTYDGVTLTFSEAVPTCELAGGRPAILTHLGDVTITNDTPAAGTVDGYFGNGAMWNPWLESNWDGTHPQGFDESPENPSNPRRNSTVFSAAACIAPSYAGNLTVSQGETGTFVKAVRRAGEAGDYYLSIEKYVPFTFLDAVPVANAVRPSMSGLDKSCTVTPDDFDYSVFQSVAKPASMRSISDALARIPQTFPHFGWGGETLRMFVGYPSAVTDSGYAGQYARANAELWNGFHTNVSNAEKADALLVMIEWARDLMGLYERGWRGGFGAGQWHGVHEVMFLGAFVLNDSAMLAAAQDVMSNIYAAEWTGANDENLPVGFPSLKGNPGNAPYARPFFTQDVGKPHYIGDGEGGSLNRRYLSTAGPAMFSGNLFLMGLKNGPGGITGAQAIAQGTDFTTANPLAAPVAYVDRQRTWQPWNFVDGMSQWMLDFYDAVRGSISPAVFTCIPDAYEGTKFSAGAGSISWNLSTLDYDGNLPVTDTWIRYGIDQVSFVEANGLSVTGSITGLNRGVPHYCQYAQENSKGRAVWSPNYPAEYTVSTSTPGPLRDVVTPTGTVANAAPSWSGRLAPALFYAPAEGWGGPYYLEVNTGATLPDSVTKLVAGVGYPSGYPAPTPDDFEYEWQRNGTPISGATGKTYHLTPDDLGQDIRCEVTVTTAQGTASQNTDAVTIYSAPILPAGVIWDTSCAANMAVFFPEIVANAVMDGAGAVLHMPSELLTDQVPTSNIGIVYGRNDGTRPSWMFKLGPLSGGFIGNCAAGKTYRYTFDLIRNGSVSTRPLSYVENESNWWKWDLEFRLSSVTDRDTADIRAVQIFPKAADATPDTLTITGTFTPVSTGPVYAKFHWDSNVGGKGGDLIIDGMKFEEI